MRYFGTKIRLRAIERQDLPRYVEWFSDAAVSENLMMQSPTSLAHEERWYAEILNHPVEEQPLAIDARQAGGRWKHIGGVGFEHVDKRNRSAECGILIGDRKFQNRGYGTDALKTLLRYGFDTLNLNRISLRVYEFNVRAMHVYEKIGFVKEGTLREAHFYKGRYWSMHLYSILRREWEARSGAHKE